MMSGNSANVSITRKTRSGEDTMDRIKTPDELEKMRKAGAITGQILRELCAFVNPGFTPIGIDALAESRCAELGVKPAFKGYRGFPGSICVSVNNEVAHGIPGKRSFQIGDIVKLDFGVILDGYYGDAARTVAIGNVTLDQRRLILTTQKSLDAGIAVMKPGNRLGDISAAVQKVVEDAGYSVVKVLCGHGIGKALHEEPAVPNYGQAGKGTILKPGMVFAIEPIVNIGSGEVCLLDDKWTLVSADRSLSAHFEDTIAITETGNEILTR